MKKGIVLATVLCLVVALTATIFTGCTSVQTKASTYVSVRINPEIDLIIDNSGKVMGVLPINSDGEILLSTTDLVGLDVDKAVEEIVDLAKKAGYLSLDEKVENIVNVGVEGADIVNIEAKIKDGINKYFANNGIFGCVNKETLEQYATQATEWGLSTGHTKLIMKLLEINPDLSVEELKAMSQSQLIVLLNESKADKLVEGVWDLYKQARELVRNEYAKAIELQQQLLAKAVEISSATDEAVKSALQAEYDALNAQWLELGYDAKIAEYKEELNALKDTYKEKSEQFKGEFKKELEDKFNKFKNKLDEFNKDIAGKLEDIKDLINNWQNGKK